MQPPNAFKERTGALWLANRADVTALANKAAAWGGTILGVVHFKNLLLLNEKLISSDLLYRDIELMAIEICYTTM
jgi:hypothetical protein